LGAGGFFVEVAEGEGETEAGVRGFVLVFEVAGHAVHLIFVKAGFDDPKALEAPAADGDFFDDEGLAGSGGEVVFD
jgi:hypothetical protein